MTRWTARLGAHVPVVAFDYPYRLAGRGRPDPTAVLEEAHIAAIDSAARVGRVGLLGHSMGGRIGIHVATPERVVGAVALSYPLFGSGDPNRSRAPALVAGSVPTLFVAGDRDPLAPLDALQAALATRPAPWTLHVVAGGDHSLKVRKAEQAAADDGVLAAILAFFGI